MQFRRRPGAQALSGPERGCTLSHRRAWEAFLASDRTEAIILEDDVEIAAGLGQLAQAGLGLPGLDVPVKIEWHPNRLQHTPLVSRELMRPAGGRYQLRSLHSPYLGSAGYWLSRKGAQALLARTHVIDRPADRILFDPSPLRPSSKAAVLNPPLVRQVKDLLGSDIQLQSRGANRRYLLRQRRRNGIFWMFKRLAPGRIRLPDHATLWR